MSRRPIRRPRPQTRANPTAVQELDSRTIGVMGATAMGRVVARFFAESAFNVQWVDLDKNALYAEFGLLRDTLSQRVLDEYLEQKDVDDVMARVQIGTDPNALKPACCVIETVEEELDAKQKVLGMLETLVDPRALMITTSYDVGVTKVSEALRSQERVMGMHLLGLGGTFQVAEIIPTERTSPRKLAQFRSLLGATFVTPIEVSDRPGYLLNRMLLVQINEAAFLVFEGSSSIEDIDLAIQSFTQQVLGPLALADLIGVDVVVKQLEALYLVNGDKRYQPCQLLRDFVKAGRLGRNTGRGFYQYS